MVITPFFTAQDSKTAYFLSDEKTKEAVLINIFEVNAEFISLLENYKLKTLYITDRQGYTLTGLKTLFKIYQPKIMTPEKNSLEKIGNTEIISKSLSTTELLIEVENVIFSGYIKFDRFARNEKIDKFVYSANLPVTTIKTISELKLLKKEY